MKISVRTVSMLAIAALFALAAAGCGSDNDSTATAPAQEQATGSTGQAMKDKMAKADDAAMKADSAMKADGKKITTGSVDPYGKILQDSKGRTIYLFTKESSEKSECYGACATAWPPVLTKGDPVAGGGVDTDKLGTTKRKGGGTQVTYNGHPLYYYVDEPAGQVLCQAVDEFGGIWYVIDKSGNAITSS